MKTAYKQVLSFVFLFSLILGAVSFASPAYADESLIQGQVGLSAIGDVYGDDTPADIRVTIARVINVILTFLGVIFIVLTIYAGFQYMTAAGNKDKTEKALALIKNAVIGLLIILMAWGLTRFTIRQLSRTVNGSASYLDYSAY